MASVVLHNALKLIIRGPTGFPVPTIIRYKLKNYDIKKERPGGGSQIGLIPRDRNTQHLLVKWKTPPSTKEGPFALYEGVTSFRKLGLWDWS